MTSLSIVALAAIAIAIAWTLAMGGDHLSDRNRLLGATALALLPCALVVASKAAGLGWFLLTGSGAANDAVGLVAGHGISGLISGVVFGAPASLRGALVAFVFFAGITIVKAAGYGFFFVVAFLTPAMACFVAASFAAPLVMRVLWPPQQ